jgi:hypothetical protein
MPAQAHAAASPTSTCRRAGRRRDPGPRPYAHTTSKPGTQGRKHYSHSPCRLWPEDPIPLAPWITGLCSACLLRPSGLGLWGCGVQKPGSMLLTCEVMA